MRRMRHYFFFHDGGFYYNPPSCGTYRGSESRTTDWFRGDDDGDGDGGTEKEKKERTIILECYGSKQAIIDKSFRLYYAHRLRAQQSRLRSVVFKKKVIEKRFLLYFRSS